jgi:transcriptional regulator with XRE-family HTH domain
LSISFSLFLYPVVNLLKTSEKIKTIRKELRLTQSEFASPLRVAGGYISALESGGKEPSETLVTLLRQHYRISNTWWETGEGDMFLKPPPPPTNLRYLQPKKSAGIAADPTEEELERERAEVLAALSAVVGLDAAELIEVFIKLPRSKQKKILGNAIEEYERQGIQDGGNE